MTQHNQPDYALFVHDPHEANGGWHDFAGTFYTADEAMAAGANQLTTDRQAHIVRLSERRIILECDGRSIIESTITGQPPTVVVLWAVPTR